MKILNRGWFVLFILINAFFTLGCAAAVYYGPKYDQQNSLPGEGTLAGGRLQLTDTGSGISATFNRGNGSFTDFVVIYLDTGTGQLTDTKPLTDYSSTVVQAVSGGSASHQSVVGFAPGFKADYAIALNPDAGGSLFHLPNGASSSLGDAVDLGLSPRRLPNDPTFTFSFQWAALGITGSAPHSFKFETTYLTGGGYRSTQTFENCSFSGLPGLDGTLTFSSYDTFGVAPVPEPAAWGLASALGLLGVCGVRWIGAARSGLRS